MRDDATPEGEAFATFIRNLAKDEAERIAAESADKMIARMGASAAAHTPIYRAIERSIDGGRAEAEFALPELTFEETNWIRRAIEDPTLLPVLHNMRVQFHRSVTSDQTSILGGAVTSLAAWYALGVGNPWGGDTDTATLTGGDAKVPGIGKNDVR